jgi:Zn-dependent protease
MSEVEEYAGPVGPLTLAALLIVIAAAALWGNLVLSVLSQNQYFGQQVDQNAKALAPTVSLYLSAAAALAAFVVAYMAWTQVKSRD